MSAEADSTATAATPAEGDMAPDFELPDQDGNLVRLSDLRGKPVVIYFYPKDDTPGCTKQACDIRDRYTDFDGAVVLGISPDDTSSHQRFQGKYEIPFPLLADTDKAVCKAYGVWGQRSFAGHKYMGVERSTFVIDAEGKIAEAWRKVKAGKHADWVLDSLAELSS